MDRGKAALAAALLERFRDGRRDALNSSHESILGARSLLSEEFDLFDFAMRRLREAAGMTEYAWLVENGAQGEELRYRTMDQMGIHWTPDPWKAIRFARRADAEMFAEGDEDAWRIVEHGFDVHITPDSAGEAK